MYITNIDFKDFNPNMLFCVKGIRQTKECSHKHNHMEIAYIMSGKAIFNINNRSYEVEEGDIILINPEYEHYGMPVSVEKPSLEFFVGFSNFKFNNMEENTLFLNEYPIIKTTASSRKKFIDLIEDIMKENSSNQTGKDFMLKSYLTQFILLSIREKKQENTTFSETKKSTISKEIQSYFHEHFAEKISLEQIAKNLYLSPFYISKVFKEEIGETPINYLIKIRLENAKDLLLNQQNLSIKEISSIVGYEDAYHFSKSFKKYYGLSPAEYKKLHIS